MTATTVIAFLGLVLGAPSAALALYNFVRAREEKARLDREIGDRKAVEARANELVRSLPSGTDRPINWQTPQEYVLGQDPLLDRAVRLAHEWRAVMLRWNLGRYQVRLRSLNEPPDGERNQNWY